MRGLLLFFSPGRLLLVACVVVSIYLVFTASDSFVHAFRLADDEAKLRQQVADLQAQEQRLTEVRDYLRSDEYLEYVARDVLGLVKPGETIVNVQAPTDTEGNEQAGEPWWQPLFGR